MKLTFLGTRGEIDVRTPRHRMHSSLLVSWRRTHVMIDCGADWQKWRVAKIAPTAMVITHAHPDHADGLKKGVSCPVFATQESWNAMRPGPIPQRVVIEPRCPFDIHGIRFEAFPIEHSLRAPAVGYRITTDRTALFYAPDIVSIHDRQAALAGIHLYAGDGASITRPILRRRGDAFIGHASIRMQLEWCRDEGVPGAVFTHCGTQIVSGNERVMNETVASLGRQFGVAAKIAFDGMEILLRSSS